MVYLTGDTHGELDRFRHGKLRWLSKKDTLIILGDFGFFWDGGAKEKAALEWLKKRRYRILFLDGAHENYTLLNAYPVTEAFGGRVQHIGGNLYHVCRGTVLTLEGKTFWCFGGGNSTDKEDREAGVSWWKEERPTEEDMTAGAAAIAACGNKVDYVLTHDAPSRFLDYTVLGKNDKSTLHTYFDLIQDKTEYGCWYFGCYHRDLTLTTKARCLFCDVVPLSDKAKNVDKAKSADKAER